MKIFMRLAREARAYKWHYCVAILSTLLLVLLNLLAPDIFSRMTAVMEGGVSEAELSTLVWLALVLLAVYALRILFRFLSNYLAHVAAWNLVNDTRVKLYRKMQGYDLDFYHTHRTGDLMSRVVTDTEKFELLYAHLIPEMLTNIATAVGVFVVLLVVNWKLALLTAVPIPLVAASSWFYTHRVRPNFKKAQALVGDINAVLQDDFSGMTEIQSFNREESEAQKLQIRTQNHTKAILHALKISSLFHPLVDFASGLGSVIVVGVGGYLAFRNQLSVADVVAFFMYLTLFYTPIAGMARLLEDGQTAYACAERVVQLMDTEPLVRDRADAVDAGRLRGDVRLEGVTFRYPDGDVDVLRDVTLECRAGQTIALVGATGVGKSTLTKLLPRFYDPTAGTIYLDGQDVRTFTKASLRRNIAPVAQDTFLFHGTLLENITYARPTASPAEVEQAARVVGIHDEIMAMPQGYQTVVGERGVRLSGGQKQRIALARALLSNAPVLVLDEATSAVDNHTEEGIRTALEHLQGTRTIIAIAHRLSSVRHADCIYVLVDGRVAESGTHEALLKLGGVYAGLHAAAEGKEAPHA